MSRVFAYCRVSTSDQTTENQRQEIAGAGFTVSHHRDHQRVRRGLSASRLRLPLGQDASRGCLGCHQAGSSGAQCDGREGHRGSPRGCGHPGSLPRPRGGGPDQPSRQNDDGGHQCGGRVCAGPADRAHPGGAVPGKGRGEDPGAASEPVGCVVEQVRQRLAAADTVAVVARDFSTSRQTIMRIRDSTPEVV